MCFSARTLIGYPTHKQRQTAHAGAKRATRPYIYAYIYIYIYHIYDIYIYILYIIYTIHIYI